MKIKQRKSKHQNELMQCPLCFAHFYPRETFSSVTEAEHIVCTSCHTDLKPYIEAYLEYVQKSAEVREQKEAEMAKDMQEPEIPITPELIEAMNNPRKKRPIVMKPKEVTDVEFSVISDDKTHTETIVSTDKPKRTYTKKNKEGRK